ncbi:MAG: hypothetical protein P4L56_12165 [Candidatus Sulfopaludibacter sp.]|nr:hypothetical protein [Candidatus Sulfopaludibacter sp.]
MSVTLEDPSLFAGQRAVEEQWRARVRAAKFRFDLAAAQASHGADCAAVEMSRAMERDAREQYLRELQAFTDIVVHGKTPE